MKRVALCALLLAWSGMAGAIVYKWVDPQGKVQYGDRPPDGVRAEVVELLGTHVARAASPSPTASATAPQVAANAAKPTAVAAKDASAKQSVDNDVAEARAKQCADAQDRYKKLIEGRRLYKTGSDGEREYLTSEQIDTERLTAKQDVDTICNSAS